MYTSKRETKQGYIKLFISSFWKIWVALTVILAVWHTHTTLATYVSYAFNVTKCLYVFIMAFRLFKYFPWNMEGSLEHCHFPFRCCLAHLRKLMALLRFRKKHLFYLRFHFATNVLPPPPPPLLKAKSQASSTFDTAKHLRIFSLPISKERSYQQLLATWKCTKLSERKPSHILHTTTKKQIISGPTFILKIILTVAWLVRRKWMEGRRSYLTKHKQNFHRFFILITLLFLAILGPVIIPSLFRMQKIL